MATTSRTTKKHALSLHKATGQYCKRYKGHVYYFGNKLDEALKRFAEEWPDIIAGRQRRQRDSITVADLVDHFLTIKRQAVDEQELSARTWSEYHRCCEFIATAFGNSQYVSDLRPEDFRKLRTLLATHFSANSLTKYITFTRSVFAWGFESDLLTVPVRYGNFFDKPAKRVLRMERAQKQAKLISAADIHKLLAAAEPQLRAMILLGINCAYGPTDCATLQRETLEVKPGWINFPRPKTGIARRCPLWPETIAALELVSEVRPSHKYEADSDNVFITKYGHRWVRFVDRGNEKRGSVQNSIAPEFRKLCKKAGVKSPGGPYCLRHVFRTIADNTKDQVAIGIIMGHHDESQANYYREKVDDARLEAVTKYVRDWLFKKPKKR